MNDKRVIDSEWQKDQFCFVYLHSIVCGFFLLRAAIQSVEKKQKAM